VMDQIFEEGMKRDPEKKRQWVYIADGDLHQLASAKWGTEITSKQIDK
jgi:hypothetical protein